MTRLFSIFAGCLVTSIFLVPASDAVLVNTRLQQFEIIESDETLELDLHGYFQNYPDPGPVATFSFTMPVAEDGDNEWLDYHGVPVKAYKLASGGLYTDPYAHTADEFLWTDFQVQFQLWADKAPGTVANFITYVWAEAYTNTIIHRNEFTGSFFRDGGLNTFVPLPIIQTGGFRIYPTDDYLLEYIETNDPITFEQTEDNSEGTIAMARGDSLNTATSQFFFNLEDNTQFFGQAYSVFGEILDPETALPLLRDFADTPVYDLSTPRLNGDPNWYPNLPFRSIPLYAPFPDEKSSFARISSVTIPEGDPSGITYSWEWVDTDDEVSEVEQGHRDVFNISIEGNALRISRTDTGYATIRVEGTAAGDQTVGFEFTIVGYNETALDKFPNSQVYQGGWIKNNWYDWLIADTYPIILHQNHGYQYVSHDDSPTVFYIYDYKLGEWIYTTMTLYPYMYRLSTGYWMYYQEGSGNGFNSPRWFYIYGGAEPGWFLETDI